METQLHLLQTFFMIPALTIQAGSTRFLFIDIEKQNSARDLFWPLSSSDN